MIKDINQAIVELLFQFDCVIIPNFGAFIKREKPASFSKDTQSFHPSSVELIFNQQLKEDDALLLKYIQLKHELTTSEASQQIKNYIDELRIILFNEGTVEFSGLGKMTLNIYDQIIFNGQTQIPLLQKQFGFQSIHLEPILKTEKELGSPRKTRFRYIAAAITIPVFLISAWASLHPEKIKDTYYHYASMIPFQSSAEQIQYKADFEVKNDLKVDSERKEFLLHLEEKINTEEVIPETVQEVVEPITTEVITEKNIEIVKPFHIIVGAFSSKKNAEKKVSQLERKGFTGLIIKLENSKLHRVSVQDFITEAKAELVITEYKQKFKGAWILDNQ